MQGSKSSRYRAIGIIAVVFLSLSFVTRLGLLFFDAARQATQPTGALPAADWLTVFGVGLIYDLAAVCYLVVPFGLIALIFSNSNKGNRAHAITASIFAIATIIGILFISVSEGIFWNEFSSRFNFIAVDYLIYTREVIGNIRQSYPVSGALTAIALVGLALFLIVRKRFWFNAVGAGYSFSKRLLILACICLAPVLSYFLINDTPKEWVSSTVGRELAGNGPYEFMHAFWANDLDYRRFYAMLAPNIAQSTIGKLLNAPTPTNPTPTTLQVVSRTIKPAQAFKPLNVVLVSIESLGSDYVESFGGKKGLTPNLDALAKQGLQFTNLYATGLRTVRGLEALTLSLPPTPGHAVPMRKDNKGFQTVGGVLKAQGYEPLYIYGGYSTFDNMKDFFGGNGYTVIDRTAIDSKKISHETIWGVADEDLFALAIDQIDQRVAKGTKVFAHIMTTTNHRPFTYPAGRVAIASGASREGAVQYTDYAIGKFIETAKTKPWFDDTLFVLVADHTSNGRGRTNLPPENYLIPMIMLAPKHIAPAKIDWLASQIDVAPTLLALLNTPYTSQFFGHDILSQGQAFPRALFSNYLTVGYMTEGKVLELSTKQSIKVFDAKTGAPLDAKSTQNQAMATQAIAYYQNATELLRARANQGK